MPNELIKFWQECSLTKSPFYHSIKQQTASKMASTPYRRLRLYC
jgi:hypothetical protein